MLSNWSFGSLRCCLNAYRWAGPTVYGTRRFVLLPDRLACFGANFLAIASCRGSSGGFFVVPLQLVGSKLLRASNSF